MTKNNKKVYIIILNYNGWADTIECLESVLRNNHQNYQVVVIDNNSPNNSMEYIKAWAEGKLDVWVNPDNPLRHLSSPPVKKPIPYVFYNREEAEKGGNPELEEKLKNKINTTTDYLLVLIQTGNNIGFAGGNNVGLRYTLSRDDFEYVWLLNNDTVVKPEALTQMVKRMKERPDAGMCGSTLPFYYDPEKLWALAGATYNKWFAMPQCIGLFQPMKQTVNHKEVEKRMDYLAGASMLLSRLFLHDIGLMSEDYFLYFEELDWAMRARGRYALAYAPKSIVYHRVSASNVSYKSKKNNRMSEYFMYRNKLLFTYKFFPFALLLVLPTASLIFLLKQLRSIFRIL